MPPELACEFLGVFSRMEYALKATGYATGTGKVEAWWDQFANEIDVDFRAVKDQHFINAVEFILKAPPRKQVLKEGVLEFIEQTIDQKQTTAQQVLLMVRTVRNNLFHGAKFLPVGEAEAGRNARLVESSLIVLERCLTLNARVHECFYH